MKEQNRLARVRWYLGQSLLPEHLLASEQSLSNEAHVRSALYGLPEFGVARLRWNEELLASGVLSIMQLTLVLREGTLVDVPRNATSVPLTLAMTGTGRVPVYLHLLEHTETAAGNPLYSGEPAVVQRVMRKTQLSTMEKVDRSLEFVKLAEFEKLSSGRWALSPAYLPPLLRIGDSPFLVEQLAELEQQLSELEPKLVAQLQDTFLRLERIAVTRQTLAAIYEVLSVLADLRFGVGRHPYELFALLRALFFSLCTFHEVLPEQSTFPFNHAELGSVFARLFALLGPRLRLGVIHHSHMKFIRNNGLFVLSGMTEEVKKAQEVYLLIQRPSLHERIALDEVKISATSRLALVQRLVLRGIPFSAIERVHFQHSFGPEVDFYQLTLNEEWALAARESSLAFYETAVLAKAQAYLFWR